MLGRVTPRWGDDGPRWGPEEDRLAQQHRRKSLDRPVLGRSDSAQTVLPDDRGP